MSLIVVDTIPGYIENNLRIELDGVDPLPLEYSYGIVVSQVDLGWPAARTVDQSRSGQDGTFDQSAFHGGRVVTVRGCIFGDDTRTRQSIIDGLRRFCHPGSRPWLYFRTEQGGDERRMQLRSADQSMPMSVPGIAEFTVSWVAPDGVALGTEDLSVTMEPEVPADGRVYDLTFPRTYPFFDPDLGRGICHNAGNTWAVPTITIQGPCTNPTVTNETVDKTIGFDGLVLSGGESVVIVPSGPSVLLNGEAGASRYSLLDFDVTEMWLLEPGDNRVRFACEADSAGAACTVEWNDTYL